jgi:hypothetical protein
VGVERDQELARRHLRPVAEVETVPPDHPAQEEVPALARPPVGGTREEVPEPEREPSHPDRPEVLFAERAREPLEGRADVGVGLVVPGQEGLPERPVADQQPMDAENGRRQVDAPGEAIVKRGEPPGIAGRIEGERKASGRRAEPAEQPLDPRAEQIDAAVGEARAQEGHDLAVERVGVAARILDGVARETVPVLELPVESVQRAAQPFG